MGDKILENPNKSKITQSRSEKNLTDFYLQPEFIRIFAQQLAEQNATDQQKIAHIKELINNNQLNIDPLALAEKIVEFETGLASKDPDPSL